MKNFLTTTKRLFYNGSTTKTIEHLLRMEIGRALKHNHQQWKLGK